MSESITAAEIAESLGIEAIRQQAESIHRNNPRTLGELHPIWCTGHAVMNVALKQRKEPPPWWSKWRQKGGELEKLTHLVNPHTPVHVSARADGLTLCDCGHLTAHPMSASGGSSCPDCYDRMSE